MTPSRILLLALVGSILLHFSIYYGLAFVRGRRPTLGHGVVSVDFIQAVQHEAPIATKAKPKSNPKAIPKAPAATQPTVVPAPALPISTPAGDPNALAHESNAFIGAVTGLLSQSKIYPRESIEREEEGRVIVGLTLDRNGQVIDAKIEEACVFVRLNEAALQTVKGVARFPEVPALLPAPIHLHVPLVFQIEHR